MLLGPNHEKLRGLTSFHYMFIKQLSSIEFSKSKVDIDILINSKIIYLKNNIIENS
jgi:hypothetical protein